MALVTCLVASALIGIRIGPPHVNQWLRAALLFFGIFNVFVSAAGPDRARAIAIGVACVALAWPTVTAVVAVFAWLVWVPGFMVGWAFEQHARISPTAEMEDRREALAARIGVAAVIGAVAI